MGERLSQHDRLFLFDSPLGGDKFVVRRLEGEEEISRLFRFTVELLSEDPYVDETALLGKKVTLAVRQSDGRAFRYFNGRVSWFRYAGPEGSYSLYRAEVVPWTWLLTQTWDCNVRQNKSVPAMVADTFKRYGFGNDDFVPVFRHDSRYTPWEFSCQYRETAHHYVSRLLEAEGIFYFYRQTQGGHQMVLADDNSACEPCPYQSKFRMDRVRGSGVTRVYDTVFTFDLQRHLRSGRYLHRDFNFLHPDPRHLHAEAKGRGRVAESTNLDVFDYPGEYEEQGDGRTWAQLRMEEEEAKEEVFEGTGNARSLIPGFRFELSGHERREWNRAYIVTRVEHSGEEANLDPALGALKPRYENRFKCIPADTPFRPESHTEKAMVTGPQTAIVVGPKDEEIHTDPHGRVRVKFHWDHTDNKGDDCSFWVRVAHPLAGSNWGAMFLPRVGQEVVVEFLEGDPDRPIVTGRVYNADQTPPWPLPAKKNISGIRTRSTKSGGPKNYNEISFDDTRGEELFALHAEKDFRLTVENDETDIIDRDRFVTVKRDHTEVVERHRHLSVDGDARQKVQGTLDEETGGQHTEKVGGSRHTTVGGDWNASVGGHVSLRFGSGAAAESGGKLLLHTSEGLFARDDSKVLLETGGELTLKGPGGFITINGGGIYIQGSMVYLNSGGGAVSYPDAPSVSIDKPQQPLRPPGASPLVPVPAVPGLAAPEGLSTELAPSLAGIPAQPGNIPSLADSVANAARQRLAELAPDLQRATQRELEAHSRLQGAARLAPLAASVYGETGAPSGWSRSGREDRPSSLAGVVFTDLQAGFQAALFESQGEQVLALHAEPPAADGGSGVASARETTQQSRAVLLTQSVKEIYGDQLRLTGHALGGALATLAGRSSGLEAQVFNATAMDAAASARLPVLDARTDRSTHHYLPGAASATVDPTLGRPQPLPAVDEQGQPVTWVEDFSKLGRQGMDFMQHALKHEQTRILQSLAKVL